MKSKIYFGEISHRRFKPKLHAFRYSMFMMYIDLDEMPTLFDRFLFWSFNRPNIAALHTKNYLSNEQGNIKQAVKQMVESKISQQPQGPIRMLTHLSYFGGCFNPVTFYYCFNKTDTKVDFVVAQINNTPWDERHCYVLTCNDSKSANAVIVNSTFDKSFHVSPFFPMDMQYQWRFTHPKEKLAIVMKNFAHGEHVFDACLKLNQKEINSRNLAKALIRFPLMGFKVVAAIYWQALRLWLKRIPFYSHQQNTLIETSSKGYKK
ncbi:DUF1365 domain-containing protein [Aliikangiella sp. IMCC44632]